MPGAFYKHIADAIVINKARMPRYAALSGGRSKNLSRLLIWFEYTCVPFALWFDRKARPFNARGVPIGDDDFASMEAIKPLETPPPLRGRTSPEGWVELKALLKAYRRALSATTSAGDFMGAAAASAHFLHAIEEREKRHGAHLCMVRHFVESLGLAALNGPRFAEQTGGETIPLTRRLIQIQALGMISVLWFDKLAQPVHEMGAGILLNDVPDIPFLLEYEKKTAAKLDPVGSRPLSSGST